MTKRILVTVGDVLKEEFLKEMNISNYKLAKAVGVSQTNISDLVRGRIRLTPDMAYRLGVFFKTGTEFWLNLQVLVDEQYINEKYRREKLKIPTFEEFFHA